MSLIQQIPGVSFTDTTIPKLYRDQIANAGTLDIFDALEPYSWASQDDPAEGSDTWKSLIGDVPNQASFAGTVGWDDGFTLDATADLITMPSTFKLAADGKGVVAFWLKIGTQAFTSGNNNYIARVGNIGGANQWVCYLTYGTTDANTYLAMYSGNNAGGILNVALSTLPVSRIVQVAVSMEPVGGVYVYKTFLNGAKVNTFTSALATLPQPAASLIFGGSANAFTGTIFRALVDDLSVLTPEELVVLDYDTYSGRFA